jgi:hypothetical protein
VKGNHKGLYEDIKLLFEDADKNDFKAVDAAKSESLEKSGGRIEERCDGLIDIQNLESAKEWAGCSSVGRVTRKRTQKEKTSCEVCFYITSLDLDIEKFANGVRTHIEQFHLTICFKRLEQLYLPNHRFSSLLIRNRIGYVF